MQVPAITGTKLNCQKNVSSDPQFSSMRLNNVFNLSEALSLSVKCKYLACVPQRIVVKTKEDILGKWFKKIIGLNQLKII